MLGQTQGRVLVTGAKGMLGSQLLLDAPPGFEALGTDRSAGEAGAPGVDLTDAAAVESLFERTERERAAPVGVIHCAAYTAVDRAEQEPELARAVNALACENLARACARRSLPLVVVSTDFVFDGESDRPYREDDAPAPKSVYGATKLEGELRARAAHPTGVAVVRTQWLYGPRGNHFPGTILRLAGERPSLKVVSDQIGSPTSTLELSPALWSVLMHGAPGIYHAACAGRASWYELAVATLECAGVQGVTVQPCTTAEFPRPAARPAFSVLDCSKLTQLRGRTLAPWRAALARYFATVPART
jgi:dTDP-4-dehydrorhamnose reductase